MKKIYLKVWPEHFVALIETDPTKRKSVELRLDDRGYERHDVLVLQEFDPEDELYTGRETERLVTHIDRGEPWLAPGYVALSICEVPVKKTTPMVVVYGEA